MGKEYISPREWLLDCAKWYSEECGNAISAMLDKLDSSNMPYEINYFHLPDEDEVDDLIYYAGIIKHDLAITLGDGKKILIGLNLPREVLGQFEEIPGYGLVPARAYEWILKSKYPEFDDEEAEILDRISQKSEEERNEGFRLQLKLLDDNSPLPEDDRQRFRSIIDSQIEFFRMSGEDREKYFDSHRQHLDFDNMSNEERYDHLKALDAIYRPIIGDNGFPDWLAPNFVEGIINK